MIPLLILRNTLRHPLRSALTVAGMAVALLAFVVIHTLLDAWQTGLTAAAGDRVVTRNRISLIFPLPIAYQAQIARIPGIQKVGVAHWFGGIYQEGRIPFAQFAVDEAYLDVYPELTLTPAERAAFDADRQGAVLSESLLDLLGVKPGDVLPLRSEIYPGRWEFKIVGVVRPRDPNSPSRELYFHWDYFNERNRTELKMEPDHVGVFVSQLAPGADAAAVSRAVDALFANSYAETLTESETSFIRGFISMSSAILAALDVISYVVIAILLLVMVNTMLISARERMHEYALLKCLGFRTPHLLTLVVGEALTLGGAGFVLLCMALVPVFTVLSSTIKRNAAVILPTFAFNPMNLLAAFGLMVAVAALAGAAPALEVMRLRVADGVRRLG